MTDYLERINDIRLTENFKLSEFQSPDTGECKLHPALLMGLQGMRTILDAPIVITSGYRTKAHNKYVNGVYDSLHLYGLAADVIIRHRTRGEIEAAAKVAGFNSIIYYESTGHFHLGYRTDQKRMDLMGGDNAK